MKAASRLYAERHVDERIMITRYEGRLRGLISLVEPTLKGEDLAAVDNGQAVDVTITWRKVNATNKNKRVLFDSRY